jgi:uncharacterized membrane protein YhaH (DUF805 family)
MPSLDEALDAFAGRELLLMFLASPGTLEPNQYGPDPKQVPAFA